MKQNMRKKRICALMMAAALVFTACGQSVVAAMMQLMKAEGTVSVLDGGGKDVSVMENMNLYSGYHVGTRRQSYAWIDLDSAKLVKMDENSDVELQKNDNDLELLVNSGGLFFNVTRPLEAGETMEIRTSTMVVGIRGTCGWVSVLEEGHMQVYILEGTVQCQVSDPVSGRMVTESVSAGEMADLYYSPEAPEEERCEIFVREFPRTEIPDFVLEEADPDDLGTWPENTESEDTESENEESENELSEAKNGEVLEPVMELSEYESFGRAHNGVMPVRKDGLWGAVDYQNHVVVPFEHTDFQAPDEQGNFVMIDTAVEEQSVNFLGETHTYDHEENYYTLFDPQGNVLYEGEHQVRATGGLYILLKEGENGEQYDIEYYRPDGTLVTSWQEEFFSARINGFYDGISLVYQSSSENSQWVGADQQAGYSYETGIYQVGEMDQNGNITWYEDPMYTRYLQENEQMLQQAIERAQARGGLSGGAAGSGSYLTRVPLSTVNHGYYVAGSTVGEAGWIAMCSDSYEFLGECDLYNLQPDPQQGFVNSDNFYNGEETNSFRGFYHDGAFFYNYGPNMVWIMGDQDVLVDFSLYPGMTFDTVDNRIVKAVYDRILMSDEAYWLVQRGDQWGYIDHDGNEVGMFEDASEFYQKYALVIENGSAYVINERFEKVQELGEADSVSIYGELFTFTRGDTRYFYRIPV